MSAEQFIADRISRPEQNKGNISRPIVKIGIAGIAIGLAVMLLSISIVGGFKSEIINKITGLTAHVIVSSININASNEPEPITLSEDSLNLLRNLPGVKTIQKTSFKNGLLKTEHENEGILLKGVDRHYDTAFIHQHLLSGRMLRYNDSAAGREVLLSYELSKQLNIQLGDKITVYFLVQQESLDSATGATYLKSDPRSRLLTVCGIFNTGFSDFDKQLGIVDLRLLQVLNGWSLQQCGSFEIKTHSFAQLMPVYEQVAEVLGYNYNTRPVTELYAGIFMWLEKLDMNGVIIVVLMVLVAIINMITALLILMLERANMIGMVKALGMSNASLRRVFLRISLRLVGKGMFWGNLIGIALCYLQYYFHIVKLDASAYYVDHVVVQMNWTYIIALNIGTFLSCGIMLLLPTMILSSMTPLKTLKFD